MSICQLQPLDESSRGPLRRWPVGSLLGVVIMMLGVILAAGEPAAAQASCGWDSPTLVRSSPQVIVGGTWSARSKPVAEPCTDTGWTVSTGDDVTVRAEHGSYYWIQIVERNYAGAWVHKHAIDGAPSTSSTCGWTDPGSGATPVGEMRTIQGSGWIPRLAPNGNDCTKLPYSPWGRLNQGDRVNVRSTTGDWAWVQIERAIGGQTWRSVWVHRDALGTTPAPTPAASSGSMACTVWQSPDDVGRYFANYERFVQRDTALARHPARSDCGDPRIAAGTRVWVVGGYGDWRYLQVADRAGSSRSWGWMHRDDLMETPPVVILTPVEPRPIQELPVPTVPPPDPVTGVLDNIGQDPVTGVLDNVGQDPVTGVLDNVGQDPVAGILDNVGTLGFTLEQNPFVCRGTAGSAPIAGRIRGFDGSERVRIEWDRGSSVANAVNGVRTFRWECEPSQARTTQMTATGLSSGESVSFSFRMVSPDASYPN